MATVLPAAPESLNAAAPAPLRMLLDVIDRLGQNDAVGYALNMIRSEEVDVMVAGGAEAPLIVSAGSTAGSAEVAC